LDKKKAIKRKTQKRSCAVVNDPYNSPPLSPTTESAEITASGAQRLKKKIQKDLDAGKGKRKIRIPLHERSERSLTIYQAKQTVWALTGFRQRKHLRMQQVSSDTPD